MAVRVELHVTVLHRRTVAQVDQASHSPNLPHRVVNEEGVLRFRLLAKTETPRTIAHPVVGS